MKKSNEKYMLLRKEMRRRNSEIFRNSMEDDKIKVCLITNNNYVIRQIITVFLTVKEFSENGKKKPYRKIKREIQKWIQKELGKDVKAKVVIKTEEGKDWTIKIRCRLKNEKNKWLYH